MILIDRPVEVEGRRFVLRPPSESLDVLIEQTIDGPDPSMPYWAHLWPSSVALAAQLLQRSPIEGPVLELGCGLGLAGLAARAAGASRVVQSDYEPAALESARQGALASELDGLEQRLLDWNALPAELERFPLVIGADVLYESALAPRVLEVLRRTLAPGGLALIADPSRGTAEDALPAMRDDFTVSSLRMPIDWEGETTRVAIHELRRS